MFITSTEAFYLTGICAWLAVIITADLIYKHLKSYTRPSQQIWIVRILFMVPIYSLLSWLSLYYYKYSIYFDVIRDCYEAFVIYNFLALCFDYLGGESEVLNKLNGHYFQSSWKTCTCCFPNFQYSHSFLRYCKRGTLQFCVVKPLMTILIVILQSENAYDEGNFSPSTGYFWITMVYNVSITIALYALFLFYDATSEFLRPFSPISKFVCVKSVIFLSYWQGFFIAALIRVGAIQGSQDEGITAGEVATCYQNFLITIEMLIAAVAHTYAFSPKIYQKLSTSSTSSTLANFKQTLNPTDIIEDTMRNFSSQYQHYAIQNQEEIPMEDIIFSRKNSSKHSQGSHGSASGANSNNINDSRADQKQDLKVTSFLSMKAKYTVRPERVALMSEDDDEVVFEVDRS